MAAFFTEQLDYILFFYGLAFILLGAVAFAVSRGTQQTIPWPMLGAFGYIHGTGEWLDLLALILGDNSGFALARTALMTVSYIPLMAFGRLLAIGRGLRMPGRWIYAPLLALVVLGWTQAGVSGANAFARYVFAFPGAILVCGLLALIARGAPPAERRWLITGAIGFGLYALAAGIVVPPTPNWDGDFFNYDMFIAVTAMPIQFVRGVLACFTSFAIWAYWGQRLVVETDSALYAKFHKRQFAGTLAAMTSILVVGWILTEVLGGIYKTHVQEEADGDINLIVSRLTGETATVEGMVRALAGSRTVGELVAGNAAVDRRRIDDLLVLETEASGASEGFILDRHGKVLVTAARVAADYNVSPGQDLSLSAFFKNASTGNAGYHFTLEGLERAPTYYVSFPIRAANGAVNGVAVLRKSLALFELDMARFERSFAMIDPNGVILVTNRPSTRLRLVWPLPPETGAVVRNMYGLVDERPLMKREIVGARWSTFDGTRDYVQRRDLKHGDWSVIIWKIPQGIFASRVVGIILTLQMAILALVYLIGRERWMHDNVQLEKRFELEELARSLDKRAATDPLTGLFNRCKFDRSLASEIIRAQRYKTQLSLMLFDIDHFKKVNDNFGHQVGDAVLVELARYTAGHIRNTDVLARWGGEEFVILSPGNSGPMDCLFAGNLLAGFRSLQIADVGTVTCSFGVAEFQDGDTAETLLARADDALYRAKSNGRNRIELADQAPISSPPVAPNDTSEAAVEAIAVDPPVSL
jgi:diguanylate cyclase (GGDEF)-like protein